MESSIPLPKRLRSRKNVPIEPGDIARYVVIGGGIAGVSCAQELAKIHDTRILLISCGDIIKEVLLFMHQSCLFVNN